MQATSVANNSALTHSKKNFDIYFNNTANKTCHQLIHGLMYSGEGLIFQSNFQLREQS
jgi:hypothetical protein